MINIVHVCMPSTQSSLDNDCYYPVESHAHSAPCGQSRGGLDLISRLLLAGNLVEFLLVFVLVSSLRTGLVSVILAGLALQFAKSLTFDVVRLSNAVR